MGSKVLTVSIAAYNVEKYIRETLESLIISDNFNDLEVLIVNDGSTDSTAVIAEEYVKKYPNVFKLINKENGGYGSTINSSTKIAKGKYFKQLDGDDWFQTENLGTFIEFLKSCNADCVYSPYWEIYQNSGRRELNTVENPRENAMDNRSVSMWALTFKLKIFTDNHITITENCFYTDAEYKLKPLFWTHSMECFNKPIYCYRLEVSGQSSSMEGWKKHFKDMYKVALEMMSYYALNGENAPAFTRNVLKQRMLSLYKYAFQVTLEASTQTCCDEYKKFDLTVKSKYPMLYKRKNLKMAILALSGYRCWGLVRIWHKLFEEKLIDF